MLQTLLSHYVLFLFFFFTDTATTEIYTLSLHDALPISARLRHRRLPRARDARDLPHRDRRPPPAPPRALREDRKSTRLNSSHVSISYAVFCLKKKKKTKTLYRLLTDKPTTSPTTRTSDP